MLLKTICLSNLITKALLYQEKKSFISIFFVAICYTIIKIETFMKSLKYIASSRQLSDDYLLRINRQPGNTCPLINTLQFVGPESETLYSLSVAFDPSDLNIDSTPLVNRINELERWASDIVNLYDNASFPSSPELDVIHHFLDTIRDAIDSNPSKEILEYDLLINAKIDHWKELFDYYDSSSKEIDELKLSIDQDDGEHTYDILERVSNLEQFMSNINEEFREVIETELRDLFEEHSKFLEIVRSNNDNMRICAHELEENYISMMGIKSPMDFLKTLESGRPDEISLGIIRDDSLGINDKLWSNTCNYLAYNNVITHVQAVLLYKSADYDLLFKNLSDNGYKTITYYDSIDTYLDNPMNFKKANDLSENPSLTKRQNFRPS